MFVTNVAYYFEIFSWNLKKMRKERGDTFRHGLHGLRCCFMAIILLKSVETVRYVRRNPCLKDFMYYLQLTLVNPCHCFLVLIFQLQIVLIALVDDRNFNEIFNHTNLSTCQSLFQQ